MYIKIKYKDKYICDSVTFAAVFFLAKTEWGNEKPQKFWSKHASVKRWNLESHSCIPDILKSHKCIQKS